MLLDLWKRYRRKQIASINEFLLPGPWTVRNGRRALPLPVQHGLHAPPGAFLRSWIDRGDGWSPYHLDRLPDRIEGPGWWGDPGLFLTVPLGVLWEKARRRWNLLGFGTQTPVQVPALPRPGLPARLPKVSILIPTTARPALTLRGPLDLAALCVRSIREKTTYPDYEILVCHNGPGTPSVPSFAFDPPGPFNLARKLNHMMDQATGDLVLLLNDDTEVIEPGWLEAMVEFAALPDVGAVGARLHYPDGRIQHAGMSFGLGSLVGHSYRGEPYDFPPAAFPREFSSVTGACLMLRKDERLDENFPNVFDAEVCLRLRSRGLRVIYAPDARLFHHESVSLKLGGPAYTEELVRLKRRWPNCLPDPFYAA